MTKPVPDKAEIAIEQPNKSYAGTFERTARFDAHLDKAGVSLTLERSGDAAEKGSVRMHFHYMLFADILGELANTASGMPRHDRAHREAVRDAARALYEALAEPAAEHAEPDEMTADEMTAEEEVLLLHIME